MWIEIFVVEEKLINYLIVEVNIFYKVGGVEGVCRFLYSEFLVLLFLYRVY